MLWAGVVFRKNRMMDDCGSHVWIVTQTVSLRVRGSGIQRHRKLAACGTLGVRISPEQSMADNRGPTKRSRFDVPISSGKTSRHSSRAPSRVSVVQKTYQRGGNGTKPGIINAGIVVAATLLTTLLLLGISGQISDTTAVNLISQSPGPVDIGSSLTIQPTPQMPSAIATPSPQPNHAGANPPTETAAPTPDDTEVQAAIDKKLGDDASLSQLGITVTVSKGKVILVGTAPSDELKDRVEKLVRAVKGVRQIDNQVVVISQ